MAKARTDVSRWPAARPEIGRTHSNAKRLLPISAALPALLLNPVWAAKWDVAPTLSVRETYTDNVLLDPDASKRADWVTQVSPGISVAATGARLKLDARYTPDFTYYARAQEENQIYHRLNATGNAELAEQLLFVDALANIDRYNVSLQGPLTIDDVNLTGNRVTIGTYAVSPYVRRDFGSEARAEARYTYSVVNSDDPSTLSDSAADAINLRLRSGPAYRLLIWDVGYGREKIGYDTEEDTVAEEVSANAGRLVTATMRLLAQAGYERYESGVPGSETKGPRWSAGLEWTPSPRTRLVAAAGERLHDLSYSFDFRHRTRLTAWGVEYREEITTSRSEFLVPATPGLLDQLFLSQIPDPAERERAVKEFIARTGLRPELGTPINFLTNELFLLKRAEASVGLLGVKNVLIFSVFGETRERLDADAAAPATGDFGTSSAIEQVGAGVQWSLRLTAFDDWNMGGTYARNAFSDTGRVDRVFSLGMGLARQFQPRLSGSLNYRRQQNDSSDSVFSYTENAVFATARMTF
jgi:uncharacterized protein (PEP-CTERM system associated)